MNFQFLPGRRFRWDKTNYQVKSVLSAGQEVRLEDLFTGERKNVAVTDLIQAFFRGEIRFEIQGKQARAVAEEGEIKTDYQYVSLEDCPEALVRLARWRLKVIEPLLKMPKRTRDRVREHVGEVRSNLPALLADIPMEERRRYTVSVSSVYRWIRDYEQGNCDLRALIDVLRGRSGAPGRSRLQGRVDEIIKEKIEEVYLKERVKATIQEVLEAVAAQIDEENKLLVEDEKMKVPVYNTIASRVNQLDPKELHQLRYGPEVTRQRFRQFNKMDPVELPLQRTEIDHTLLDLIVLDLDAIPLGRLTFTHSLDEATRHPLGYYLGFEPPSYLTVMECLKHAIMPKNTREQYGTENEWLAYGIPVSLAVDNGREFRGHGLEDACQLLGIILEPNKARSPWQKPFVERFFRTKAEGIIHTLPGTTFSNIFQRGDYQSVQQACIFVDDIDRIANIFMVDYYAQRFHRGLGGVPGHRWEAMTRNGFFPRLPANLEELTILLCPYVKRCVWHYGVEFEGLRYNSSDLIYLRTELKGAQTKIKYDPSDLSRIYVQNPFDDNKYITIPSLDPDYTQNLSLWKHRVIKRMARQYEDEADLPALWRARQKIQEIVQAGLERKKTAHRKITRYLTNGKPTRDLAAPDESKVQIIDGDYTRQEETKPLPTPPPNDTTLFTLDQKPKEGWEIVERGLTGSDQKEKTEATND